MEKSKYPSTILSIQLFCFISVSALDSWYLLHVFDLVIAENIYDSVCFLIIWVLF